MRRACTAITLSLLLAAPPLLAQEVACEDDADFPCGLQIEEVAVQKVPTIFKFQARVSQAKLPVGDGEFSTVYVKLDAPGGETLCVEQFSNVQVADSVLNLTIGTNISCALDEVIAERSGLQFVICLGSQTNCLLPVDLATVPYAVKAGFAGTSQVAHQANEAAVAFYANRATADRELFQTQQLGTGYFDFYTPADQPTSTPSNLFPSGSADDGFLQWTPIRDRNDGDGDGDSVGTLTIAAKDHDSDAPRWLEELRLGAKTAVTSHDLDVSGTGVIRDNLVVYGDDASGTQGTLAIHTGSKSLFLDANEIQATSELHINLDTRAPIYVGSDLFTVRNSGRANVFYVTPSDTLSSSVTSVTGTLNVGGDGDVAGMLVVDGSVQTGGATLDDAGVSATLITGSQLTVDDMITATATFEAQSTAVFSGTVTFDENSNVRFESVPEFITDPTAVASESTIQLLKTDQVQLNDGSNTYLDVLTRETTTNGTRLSSLDGTTNLLLDASTATFEDALVVGGALSAGGGATLAGGLDLSGNLLLNAGTPAAYDSDAGALSGSLVILHGNGVNAMAFDNDEIQVNSQLNINTDTDTAVQFGGDVNLDGALTTGEGLAVGGDAAVTGVTTLSGAVGVGGALTVSQNEGGENLAITGDTISADAGLTLSSTHASNGVSVTSALTVSGAATLSGGLSISGGTSSSSATTGTLVLTDDDGHNMGMDGNEINSSDTLHLQLETGGDTQFGGQIKASDHVRLSGKLLQEGCPSGFTLVSSYRICVESSRRSSKKTYYGAVLDCFADAAHLCTVPEMRAALSNSTLESSIESGLSDNGGSQEWLGNLAAENAAFCTDNKDEVNGFEGTCDMDASHYYRCCLGGH
jgi:hypothetical protein